MSNSNESKESRISVKDMAFVAMFSALIAVCSIISIPIGEVPITPQPFAVCLAAAMLGWKRGTLSVFIYVLLGAVGVPVNAGDASLAYVCLMELPSESFVAFVAEVALPLKDPLNVVAYRDPGLVPRYTSESDVAVTLIGAPESW